MDLASSKLFPTWGNGRSGEESVAKWLYLFLILEGLMDVEWNIKSWVDVGGILNHMDIVLNLEFPEGKLTTPFKILPSLANRRTLLSPS